MAIQVALRPDGSGGAARKDGCLWKLFEITSIVFGDERSCAEMSWAELNKSIRGHSGSRREEKGMLEDF